MTADNPIALDAPALVGTLVAKVLQAREGQIEPAAFVLSHEQTWELLGCAIFTIIKLLPADNPVFKLADVLDAVRSEHS